MKNLMNSAREIMGILNELPMVRSCELCGSLSTGRADELSDIDILVDVSGYDNGRFMLEVTELLKVKLNIVYSDYAPSLMPDNYIVSIAIDANDPFLIADLDCIAEPHCETVTKSMIENDLLCHTIKVWTADLKHFVRGADCMGDIMRMARRLKGVRTDGLSEPEILEECLKWMENNSPPDSELCEMIASCRRCFEELTE
ncbi:MAG: nucleotidyltransferase domain-containing protein [Oscillospiraceae bacterium]|nr:nucleotidyltransferase domain-containing protein [Oscillospiraceae bacterium]